MQEVDAERRIKILRGERPPTPPPPPSHPSSEPGTLPERKISDSTGKFRKRRRVAGENDTDRDIRYAREDAAQAVAQREELVLASRKAGASIADAPILDSAGHINLFPSAGAKSDKNPEAEAEAARKKRSYEDQYTMRFSNAAGFKETIGRNPWYSSTGQDLMAPGSIPSKDVWGNEDPRRKERAQARMSANDPLAAMKRGVQRLKTSEQERKRWNDEKRREVDAMKADEAKQSGRRRMRSASIDSLDGFSLDAPGKGTTKHQRTSDRQHHRHHDRSRDRSHRRHRDRSREHSHRRSEHRSSGRSHRSRHDEPENSRRSSNLETKNRS